MTSPFEFYVFYRIALYIRKLVTIPAHDPSWEESTSYIDLLNSSIGDKAISLVTIDQTIQL